MSRPPVSDQSLLDRLNALKVTSITLDNERTNSLSSLLAEPLSKEVALSERLRTLRNAAASPRIEPDPCQPSVLLATPSDSSRRQSHVDISPLSTGLLAEPLSLVTHQAGGDGDGGGDDGDGDDDIDNLFFDEDETTLEELLEGLDLERGNDLYLDKPPWSTNRTDDESKEVTALLEQLRGNDSRAADLPSSSPKRSQYDDDNSEGEEMSAEIGRVLSQARDEADSEKRHNPTVDYSTPGTEDEEQSQVSSHATPNSLNGKTTAPTATTSTVDEAALDLCLPSVPSKLQDPVPAPAPADAEQQELETEEEKRKSVNFENDITVRLAALKGLGSGINTDSFGLPSAPTFQPEDRIVKNNNPGKKVGYTDEDQKTWCIVCLEDATIRCIGCDDDVYCSRCWRDMHVGPAAGYDERGHQWAKFERNK